MTQEAESNVSKFREFLPSHFAGQTVTLAEIYAVIKMSFAESCDDALLCNHEEPRRPEWQHQVRQALDYLHNKQKLISNAKRGSWTFPG